MMIKKKKGITLIELVIVIALIGLILGIIFSPVFFSFLSFNSQNEKAGSLSEARSAMSQLTKQVRKAEEVNVENNEISADGVVYKLQNDNLYRNAIIMARGIESFSVSQVNKKITITVSIKNKSSRDYSLSAVVYRR